MNLQDEREPADAVEARWQRMPLTWRLMLDRADSKTMGQGVLALIEAASKEPRLRRLYPFTSHWTLWFSSRTSPPFNVGVPAVEPLADGRFRVRGPRMTNVIGEADTAEAAIALVVAQLPPD
ncbi:MULTISPECIES: DUF6193 family natural product biosynthesis protein [unclassified Streptomyces]|uniref:DUF6193 family natural product biosynthesis protein n=1 Tax=unclassified Streptomyces TaxID=2593676 RepID=UPI00226F5D21|nr:MULTISPECIES: DUF6193 family natural product biosynthesis protein [unclassified Streptomyces]MCY0918637.1 DUF6193 family natural product biosynthesis protein [Streptomyces sp. H27-G5]MCY0961513.1 DUF6193 family natural product biosynthesis protein [Streptomyces sp. H27-H5]